MLDEIKTGETGGGVATESAPAPEPTITPAEGSTDTPAAPAPLAPTVKLPTSIGKVPQSPTGRFQGRISELVAQRNAATAESASLREQVSRMQSIPRAGEKTTTPAVGGKAALNPDDFPTYGEYVEALAGKVWEEKETAKTSKQATQDYENYRAKKQSEFQEHSTTLAAAYGEGYWDAVTDPNLPISEAMSDAVIELDELGPMTMLYLAANRGEAGKIARMNPRAATIAIGRIAAKLDADIKAGNVVDTTFAPEIGNTNDAPGGATPTGTPAIPRPTPVPVPRGSTPALQAGPSDKDDVQTWLRKETERMRKMYPNGRFYGA